MLTQDEKLKIQRQGATNPGLAILSCFQIMSDEIMAQLSRISDKLEEGQNKNHGDVLKTLDTISINLSQAVEDIESSVEEINSQMLDEETIVESLSEKIQIPVPTDGHTPTEEELKELIKALLPLPEKKGKGVSMSDIRKMIKGMMPKIEIPKPMSDEELAVMLESIVDKKNINKENPDAGLAEKIKGIEEQLKLLLKLPRGAQTRIKKYLHGGSDVQNSSFVDNEVVSGSNTAFVLANTPLLGSVKVYANGQKLTPGAGNDYTISGKNITTVNSFSAGTLIADYRK